MNDTIIRVDSATTMYINHPEASYGIFCFNQTGDLFLNSDWGFYGFSWRAFDGSFKQFLMKCDQYYITHKFAINYNQNKKSKDWLGGKREQAVVKLVELFLTELKKLPDNPTVN